MSNLKRFRLLLFLVSVMLRCEAFLRSFPAAATTTAIISRCSSHHHHHRLVRSSSSSSKQPPKSLLRNYYFAIRNSSSNNNNNNDNEKKLTGPLVQPTRPNENTYWVSDKFLAGEYPGGKRTIGNDNDDDNNSSSSSSRERLRQYLNLGINSFIDLTKVGEREPYETLLLEEADRAGIEVEYKRFPIQDFGIPTRDEMRKILDYLDGAIMERNKTTYVHCRGGIGRTGTCVGCYLVRQGNSGTEALNELHRLFQSSGRSLESPSSPETDEQMKFVKEWKD